jgi:hypothetical protein
LYQRVFKSEFTVKLFLGKEAKIIVAKSGSCA